MVAPRQHECMLLCNSFECFHNTIKVPIQISGGMVDSYECDGLEKIVNGLGTCSVKIKNLTGYVFICCEKNCTTLLCQECKQKLDSHRKEDMVEKILVAWARREAWNSLDRHQRNLIIPEPPPLKRGQRRYLMNIGNATKESRKRKAIEEMSNIIATKRLKRN